MKVILPPIVAILVIIATIFFIGWFPPGDGWLNAEGNFDITSMLFIIRNAALIVLGIIFTFMFSDGFTSKDSPQDNRFKFLLPVVMGFAGALIMILLVKPLYYPTTSTWMVILFILVWVVAEELFFRSFLTKSLMNSSNPEGANLMALFLSSLIYAFWNVTYFPIVLNYSLSEYLAISVMFFIGVSLPVTASYYYSKNLFSSGITNFIIKTAYVMYCIMQFS